MTGSLCISTKAVINEEAGALDGKQTRQKGWVEAGGEGGAGVGGRQGGRSRENPNVLAHTY